MLVMAKRWCSLSASCVVDLWLCFYYCQKSAMVSIFVFQLPKNNKVPANCQIMYTAIKAFMIFAYSGVRDCNSC